MGEPGKADNKVSTIPHKKMIEAVQSDNKKMKLPYSFVHSDNKVNYNPCRSVSSLVLYPGETLPYQLPPEMSALPIIHISPRRGNQYNWFQSKIQMPFVSRLKCDFIPGRKGLPA